MFRSVKRTRTSVRPPNRISLDNPGLFVPHSTRNPPIPMKSLAKLLLPLTVLIIASSPLLADPPTIVSAGANAANTVLTVSGTNLSPPDKNHSLIAVLDGIQLTIASSTLDRINCEPARRSSAGLLPAVRFQQWKRYRHPPHGGHLASLDVTLPATGPKGATGATGASGATGATGTAGANGATGSPGANGLNGAPGATGPSGPIGPKGATGSTGSQGPTGTQGPQGITGPTGPAGGGGLSILPVISMTWSSSPTPIPNPADGIIGCNNADPAGDVTQIWSSFKGTDHVDYSSLFNSFSFDVGGYLVIRNVSPDNGSPQNILVFPLSRYGYNFDGTNQFQTIDCTAATIWLGSGFADGDQVIVSFLPPAPDLPPPTRVPVTLQIAVVE